MYSGPRLKLEGLNEMVSQNNKEYTMKVKIFYDASYEMLESEVNKWLADNPAISITEILQTGSDDSLTISIFYI